MASFFETSNGRATTPEIMPIVFGTARYGAEKVDGVIVPSPGPHDKEITLLREAIARGYNFIDTAQGYGDSELVVGQAVDKPSVRGAVTIATKVLPGPDVAGAIKESVRRLNTEPDVLYIHDRRDGILDGAIDECFDALDDAIDDGLAGAIGISNFRADELAYAIASLSNPVRFYQAKVNLHQPRIDAAELQQTCQENEIIFTASSALDRGNVLHESSPELTAMAERYSATLAQLAIIGLRHLDMFPVVMTKNLDHMDENKAALSISLDQPDVQRLADILLSR